MKVLVLLNAAAGTLVASKDGDEPERIARGFARHGITAEVRAVEGPKLCETTRTALGQGYDAILAGGGDGTINAVASQLVHGNVPFCVLPLGTLNHLAKELNVPADLDQAVDAIAAGLKRGEVEPFTVGEVNGQVFLLFSAVGLYPNVIKHRDAQRKVLGRKKWPAMAVAMAKSLARLPVFRVRMKLPDSDVRRLTPLVFVALSEHQIQLFGVTDYSCPGRDLLNVYVAKRTRPLGVAWLILKALFRTLKPAKDFDVLCVGETEITLRRRHTRVGIDGEVIDLQTPLRYRVLPGALRMIKVAGHAGATPEAPPANRHESAPATGTSR